MTADFTLRLQQRDGTYIGEIPFFDLQGEFYMNKQSEIRFKTSSIDLINYVNPVSLLKEGLTEVVLLRNNVKIFTGPIWTISTTSSEKVLTITANDVCSYLNQRYIASDTKFTKKRYAYGAWKLIEDAQAKTYGDLGITQGLDATSNPTGSWSYTKKSGTVILEAITKLSEGTNGFDWEVTPDRVFNTYYPRLQIPTNINLEYGGNVKAYAVQGMGTYVANEGFMRGGSKLVSSVYSDAESQQFYGLRQYCGTDSSLKSKTKLDSAAKQQINLRKAPRLVPQITLATELLNPYEDNFGYGSIFNTYISDGWVQFDGAMRCSGHQLTIGKHGQESFVLYMNDTREIEDTAT